MEAPPQSDPVAQGINDAIRSVLDNVQPAVVIGVVILVAVAIGFFNSSHKR